MATTPSTSTPGSSTTAAAAAAAAGTTSSVGSQQTETESVTHMQMAGLTVLMIKTKDQVIYKLPDNMSVQSLSTEQREQLLAEINLLHHRQTTAQAIAATQAQTQQVQLAQAQAQAQAQAAQAQGIRHLAPLNQSSSSSSINGGSGGAGGGGGGGVSSASTPVSYRSSPSAPSTPTSITGSDAHAKTTRRYNKTGKYSKKKFGQHGSDRTAETSGTNANGQPYLRIQKPQPAFGSSSSSQAYPTAQQTSATTVSGITSASAPRQQVIGLSTEDQKRQVRLLQEIHQLQQQVESHQTRLSTFRDQEQTIRRALALLNNKVDSRAQELARQNVTTSEKLLETAKAQLREKENVFREQFPVASQQLLLLQQQQLLAAAATAVGSSSGSSSSLNGTSAGLLLSSLASTLAGSGVIPPGGPKTVEEQLQQCIAEHHDSVRNGMAQELQTTHKDLRRPDFRTPFSSLQDAIERLLPFHVFQYPAQDIDSQAKAFANRSEVELNARALSIHKRKYELFNKYHDLLQRSATKTTTTSPSSALDIVALRLCLDEERAAHKKVLEQKEHVQNQTKTIREDLESRHVQLLHQRKTEAALIEHQQRLMLERLRQEEQKQQQQLHMVAQIRQLQQVQQVQQLQQQQQQQHGALSTEEQELERQHQIELEEQMRKKQEQEEAERRTTAAAMAVTAALAGTSSSSPVLTRTSSTPSSSSSSTPASHPSSSH